MMLLYWLTLISWLCWLIFYWRGGAKVVGDVQHSLASGQSRLDTAALLTIIGGNLVLVGTGLALIAGWLPTDTDLLRAGLGAALMISGLLGTFYCRHYLGRLWAADSTLQEDHRVIDSGPYGLVRHPIYTVVQIMYIGMTLVFLTGWTIVTYAVILIAHLVKTAIEDQFLAEHLPDYHAYQAKVRFRLMPGIW